MPKPGVPDRIGAEAQQCWWAKLHNGTSQDLAVGDLVLRVVLIPAFVQRLPGASERLKLEVPL